MSFEDYWAKLTTKNPLLKTGHRLSVSPEKLKAMLSQSYTEGFERGKKVADDLGDVFSSIFGGKK